jgi:hypothetical protein
VCTAERLTPGWHGGSDEADHLRSSSVFSCNEAAAIIQKKWIAIF